jgi:hypothetical protein
MNTFIFIIRCVGLIPVILSGLVTSITIQSIIDPNIYIDYSLIMIMMLSVLYVSAIIVDLSMSCTYRVSGTMYSTVDIALWVVSVLLLISMQQDNIIGITIAFISNTAAAILILLSLAIDITIRMIHDDEIDHV